MNLQKVVLIMAVLSLASCSGGGGGSGAATPVAVQGNDYSGTYILAGIECFSSTTGTYTDSALLASYSTTMVISGNSYTSTTVAPSCQTVTTGKLVFNSDYTLSLSQMTVMSATGGSCNSVLQVSASPVNHITPTSASGVVTVGAPQADRLTNWIRNNTSGSIGIFSVFKTTNSADLCFFIYGKQ